MDKPQNIGSAWLTTDGEVINPNAPAGGGGSGRFRTAGSVGAGDPPRPILPSPDAPVTRYLVTPDPLNADGVKPNPPPATPTGVTPLPKKKDAGNDIDVGIEVLADGVNTSEPGQAHTKLGTSGLTTTYPEVETDDKGKVTKLLTPFIQKGNITLQIRYRPGVDKAERSAYGRGTTDEDKKDGNVTVAFHELCHVKDMLAWMKAHPLPVFSARVGMSTPEYQKAMSDHGKALDQYFETVSEKSHASTDETGKPTRSQFLAGNQP